MKAPPSRRETALTRLEVLVLVVAVAIPVTLFLGAMSGAKRMANEGACVNNLKQLGLAFRIFSNEHDGEWPMALSVTNGGTREWLSNPDQLWRCFLWVSNTLYEPRVFLTPRMLRCPSDWQKTRADEFAARPVNPNAVVFSGNQHLSYFLGLNTSEDQPRSILSGDRNLMAGGIPVSAGRLELTTNHVLGWTKKIHNGIGQILFNDGSVDQADSGHLNEAWRNAHTSSGLTTNVWLVP